MRLQKRRNRKVGDKEYFKWYIDIPPEKIDELSWKEGQELKFDVKRKKLVVESGEKS